MNGEELNNKLYDKMTAEQKTYHDWLVTQMPEEILSHCYEYTVRQDILMVLENEDLTAKQAQALLKSPCPLGDVYKEFEKCEWGYMGNLRECMETRADRVIREDRLKEKKKASPAQER